MEYLLNDYPECLFIYYYLGLVYQAIGEVNKAIKVWEHGYDLISSLLPKYWSEDYVLHDTASCNNDVFAIADSLNEAYLQKADNARTKVLKESFLIKAQKLGLEMLKWCKSDGCGVRERVVETQLKLRDYHGTLRICKNYLSETLTNFENEKNDTNPGIRYGRVLAAANLEMKQAKKWLKIAIEARPLIAKILLTDKPLPIEKLQSGYTTRGGYDEAYLYWRSMAEEWWKCAQGMDLLRSHSHLADVAIENHRRIWGSALPEETRRPFPEIYCWPN